MNFSLSLSKETRQNEFDDLLVLVLFCRDPNVKVKECVRLFLTVSKMSILGL